MFGINERSPNHQITTFSRFLVYPQNTKIIYQTTAVVDLILDLFYEMIILIDWRKN